MKTTVATILTGCILHNICILNHDEFGNILEDDAMPQCYPNAQNFNANALEAGANKRLNIARALAAN